MAFNHGSKAAVYANGYELSQFLTSVSTAGQADTAEVTTLGKAAKVYIAGLEDATLSAEGIFDGAANAVDQILQAALGVDDSIWVYMPTGDGNGNAGYGFLAIETSYEIETPVDGVAAISAEAQSKVGLERIIALHAMATEAAGGNAASQNNGAQTTKGGVGYLQVVNVTGALTVKIQHSSDNGGADPWADLVTFTATGIGAVRGERKEVAGTVKQYLRVTWTGAGKFFAGFGRF